MIPLLICTAVFLVCIAVLIWSEISAERRVKKRALSRFGKLPEQEYALGDIPKYAEFCEMTGQDGRIDAITWNDLDMDLVFRRINNCQSAVGEQYLYEKLHRLSPKDSFWKDLLEHLEQHSEERQALLTLLARIGKRKGGYGLPALLFEPVEYPLPLGSLYWLLAWLPFAFIPLLFLLPLPGFCLLFGAVCLNFLLFYFGKRQVQGDLERLASLSSLLWFCEKLAHGGLTFSPIQDRLTAALPCFRSLRGNLPFLGQRGASDLELLQEYFHILTLRDLRLYRRAMKVLRAHSKELQALFETVGLLDAAVCTLSFRRTLPVWTAPAYQEENALIFTGLYHPLLRNPVPNSGKFGKDILLTGSNASGKSTFLKAIAVNAILGQSLMTCAAEHFSFRPGPVLTSMAVRDDIAAGESYFMAEVRSLKRLTDSAGAAPCLLFIDEILKGTNTAERLAASQAVLEELHRRDCLCIAATHDQELSRRLGNAYHNYHFRETLDSEGISFDYQLRPGPADTQNAIELLGILGFRGSITRRAKELAVQEREKERS